MNELSRMDRHRSRNNGRKKVDKANSNDIVFRSKVTKEDQTKTRSGELRRVSDIPPRSSSIEEHEVDVLRRSRSKKLNDEQQMLDDEHAPSRTNTYPSHRVRMSKWFVNSLIIVFILLMAGLLMWGLAGAPPLEEIF